MPSRLLPAVRTSHLAIGEQPPAGSEPVAAYSHGISGLRCRVSRRGEVVGRDCGNTPTAARAVTCGRALRCRPSGDEGNDGSQRGRRDAEESDRQEGLGQPTAARPAHGSAVR